MDKYYSDVLEDTDPLFIQAVASIRGKNTFEQVKLLKKLRDLKNERDTSITRLLHRIFECRERASRCIDEVVLMKRRSKRREEEASAPRPHQEANQHRLSSGVIGYRSSARTLPNIRPISKSATVRPKPVSGFESTISKSVRFSGHQSSLHTGYDYQCNYSEMPQSLNGILPSHMWAGDPKTIKSVRRSRKDAFEIAKNSSSCAEVRKALKDLYNSRSCSRHCNTVLSMRSRYST